MRTIVLAAALALLAGPALAQSASTPAPQAAAPASTEAATQAEPAAAPSTVTVVPREKMSKAGRSSGCSYSTASRPIS